MTEMQVRRKCKKKVMSLIMERKGRKKRSGILRMGCKNGYSVTTSNGLSTQFILNKYNKVKLIYKYLTRKMKFML